MNDRKTFVFYAEWKEIIKDYPADLRLELYEAIVDYATGNQVELSQSARLVFPFIKRKLDEDNGKYNAVVKRNKMNGKKGGRKPSETQRNPKNPVGFTETQRNPKNPVGFTETQRNPKNPVGFTETQRNPKNLDNDNDNDNELLSNSNELDNNKKKNKNNNIFIEKREDDTDFDTHFRTLAIPIWNGKECEIWRELMTKKHGIQNWGQAVIDFKNHIIEQGNEAKVMDFTDHKELKKYMTNALNVKNRDGNNFLSDDAKKVPNRTYYEFAQIQDPTKWREPCKRLPNIEVEAYGKKIIVGVVLQDGKELYCSPDLPKPPSRFHYYNPFKEIYDDVTLKDHLRQQDVDMIPPGILALKKDFYLEQHKEKYINRPLDF